MLSLKKAFLIACASLSVQLVNAQNYVVTEPDYVISIAGDTTRCTINYPLFGKPGYSVAGAKPIKIDIKEIKEYHTDKKYETYRAVKVKGRSKPLFLKVVESGSIGLYQEIIYNYSQYGTNTTTVWYVGKGIDEVDQLKLSSLIAFNKQKRKTAFEDMLKDNQAAYDKYIAADKKFTFKQIQTLVHFYNTGDWLEG